MSQNPRSVDPDRRIAASYQHSPTDTMLTSTFTGVRVAAAPKRATSRKIDTAVVARRTKASAPAKKSAFKVRSRATSRDRIFAERSRKQRDARETNADASEAAMERERKTDDGRTRSNDANRRDSSGRSRRRTCTRSSARTRAAASRRSFRSAMKRMRNARSFTADGPCSA